MYNGAETIVLSTLSLSLITLGLVLLGPAYIRNKTGMLLKVTDNTTHHRLPLVGSKLMQ